MEKGYVADYLILADQGIPNWLVKTTFWGETESATRLGIKFQFDDVGLAQVTPFAACCLFF